MVNGKSFFDQPIKNDKRAREIIWKITTDQGDDHTTGYLIDYVCFKNYCRMKAIDLRKQQELDAAPKGSEQIIFPGNLDGNRNTTMLFIIGKTKKLFSIFHKKLWKYCQFISLNIA